MKDLADLLDAVHAREGAVAPELGGEQRIAVESLLREHQRTLGPALRGTWDAIQTWLAGSPEPLAHPAPAPGTPYGVALVPLTMPHLPLVALKRASQAVVAFHAIGWVGARLEEPAVKRSGEVLRRVRALLGVGDDVPTLRTEGVIIEGFVTGLLAGWNLRAVALELALVDGPRAAAARLRALEPGLLELQQLLASSRKDVFIQLWERVTLDPHDRSAPWRADRFTLGDTLQLRTEVFEGLGTAPWPLSRQGCPARGRLLTEVDGWVAQAWERYVLTPLEAT